MLKTRTIWTLAGGAWGVVVGMVTAVQTAAFLAGVGWLFVFGDDKWPDAAGWVLLASTVIAAVVPIVLLTWLGRRLGIAFEAESRQRLRTRRRGWFVFGLAVGGILLGGAAGAAGVLTERARRADRAAAERQAANLSAQTHRITSVRQAAGSPPDVAFDLGLEGVREGEYVLSWRVVEATYDSVLARGDRTVQPGEGPASEPVAIDTSAAREAYRRIVLGGRGGVLVDEAFALHFEIRPILTASEEARIPDREVDALASGDSEFVSDTAIALPVRFELP